MTESKKDLLMAALMFRPTLKAAAKAAGITASEARSLMNDKTFQAEFEKRRLAAIAVVDGEGQEKNYEEQER